jgi:inorganic pyrophosphatase
MHPWHDIACDADAPGLVTAFVEIAKGSKVKYELDKATGLLRVDRVLFSAVHYPANYGFLPQTYCDDGDALDVLVLCQEPVEPMCLMRARPIGYLQMRDDKGIDDKIIAVSVRDPAFSDYTDHKQLPSHVGREIKRFFQDYKVLENKTVVVEDILGPAEALAIIRQSLDMYRKLRRGEIGHGAIGAGATVAR